MELTELRLVAVAAAIHLALVEQGLLVLAVTVEMEPVRAQVVAADNRASEPAERVLMAWFIWNGN
jgi:hypothetical protein